MMSDQMVSVSFKSLESFVNEDNLEGLRSFLTSRSVVIDDRDENGATVLMLCAAKGKADFCKELLLHGADVNAEDNDMWTSLITAAKEGHANVVSLLLENEVSVDHRDLGGWTAFMWSCYKGNLEAAKLLLAAGADPNAQGQHHMTSLVWAAGRGHTDIVKLLLEKGAKVNLGDKFGTTPLIWACRKGYLEITEALLAHGANVDATGMYSWTPLLVATKGNYVDLVNLLLEHKPNVNALDKDGGTALTVACKEGYFEIASALLRAGAYVNIQDRNGDSNLIYAARGGHRNVVEALLKKHVDIDCVGKDRKTALYWAVEKGHTQVVKALLSSNADMEHSTKEGDTALLRSVRTKNAEIVQMFVDKKARVNVADKKGDTALHIAMRGRSKRIVEILLRNPKNSQMLYRPNRAGETPYNIDLSHQKTILGQIFGARRLNTNEENENMLGYDLYSSSLADILSEPSLSMPISVGLYARWGSGKSFLIRKLREEMNSFARQWVEPLFQFTPLVFFLVAITSILIGFIAMMATGMWYVGLGTGGGIFLLIILCLMSIWYGSRSKYDWNLWYKWSVGLATQMAAFKLVAQVIFCSPPGNQWKEWKDGVQAKPLKFIFAEGAKPSSTGAGGNSVVQILGSMFDMVENQYGIFPTRFYRAFRPKAFSSSSPWKYRRLCGIPYIAIFFITLACGLALTYLAITYGFHEASSTPTEAEPVKEVVKRWANAKFTSDFLGDKIIALKKRNVRFDDDDDDDEEDEFDEQEDFPLNDGSETTEEQLEEAAESRRQFHGRLINPLLFILSALVALVIVANIHTLVRMVKALIFSHRRHLLSAISKFDTMSAEGYLHALKEEVNLLIEMVRCLDAFTAQQTRLVVILDGLDSCEQEKVLNVLDAVHTLFTDSNGPFIILLAIDPHIITKAIELNATKVFRESSFSGHDYLRNIIHLPFYLQNAGLRKVKLAEQAAEHMKGRSQSTWNEQETEFVSLAMTSAMGGLHHMPVTRHMSTASELGYNMPDNRRMSGESGMSLNVSRRTQSSRGARRLRPSDSVGSSIASNLHRVSAASDLNKVLLTDDYFNDINPRSMRRLMNVVYITGRLLKAFHIEFNWYHLALWINITEQWPYHASWLIHYYERKEDNVDEKTTLKELFEKLKDQIPVSKEMEPLLEMDKDERKLETFLAMHENVLHVYNLVVFLPFTINLDPYIKKKIKEEQIQMEEAYPRLSSPTSLPWQLPQNKFDTASKISSLPWPGKMGQASNKEFSSNLPPTLNPLMWGYPQQLPFNPQTVQHNVNANTLPYNTQSNIPPLNTLSLPSEAQDKKLSSLSIDEAFHLFEKVEGVSVNMLPTYKEKLLENNINGKVLLHCNLDDLKQILKMTFGDWELFKMLILGLREQEMCQDDDMYQRSLRYLSNQPSDALSQHQQPDSMSDHSDISLLTDSIKRGSLRNSFANKDREDQGSISSRRTNKLSLHSKQVTLEEQMIFGALQTLNEEAYEDVVEEQMKLERRKSCQTLDPGGDDDWNMNRTRKNSLVSIPKASPEEIDVVYIQSSPLLPHTIVSCPPDCDSTAPSLASSFSPYKGSASLSRTSSVKGGGSVTASPKHSGSRMPATDNLELVPKYRNSPIHDSSSPARRERPCTLNLNQTKEDDSGVISDVANDTLCVRFSPDFDSPSAVKDNLISGTYDMSEYSSMVPSVPSKNVSFSDQLLTGSYSLEKLKRLTKKLQKALVSQENTTDVDHDNTESTEVSPLVTNNFPEHNVNNDMPKSPPNGVASKNDHNDDPSFAKLNNCHVITMANSDKETHV
ncbi:UNVERIFIED_CONTAM: hypothetical protein RMT77_000617 [Armadillidium vulgare]